MNYQQTIDYLYNTLPMFSRMGSAAFKKDLTNIRLLCEHLGDPHLQFKTIHVAGTNGKGSVSHMLAAVFQNNGYKTGLYTSPHLYDFRERIKLDGAMIPQEFVVDFVEKIKPCIEEIEPSFFEITVAMAFQFFAEQKVDIAIIEVGLGGRLDSTNIITPELSIITNIGWDHTNLLGNSLEKIAFEKGGIIKEKIPVIIGETLPETKPIFQKIAEEKNAVVFYAENLMRIKNYNLNASLLSIDYQKNDGTIVHVKTDLPGIYQVQNVRTILTAIDILKENWDLDEEKIFSALKKVKQTTGLHGRWEVIHQKPTVVLDVAHNENGIEKLLEHLQQLSFPRLHFIFGIVKDKDVEHIIERLPKDATYYFTQAHIPRALPANELKQKAGVYNLQGEAYEDVNKALAQAIANAQQEDLIIVCGSIFLVAEVNREF